MTGRLVGRSGIFFSSIIVLCLWGLVQQVAGAASQARVARAMFTTAVEDREPINQVLILDDSFNEVYFFTDLRNMQGKTIKHRWEYKGKVVAEKAFKVKGKRWRVYSSVAVRSSQKGEWTVVVVDQDGWPLHAEVFKNIGADSDDESAVIMPLE